MRNVIRDIFSNWRNIFGRNDNPFPPGTGLPYSFTTPTSHIDITMYSGYNVPLDYEIAYIHNGTPQAGYGTVSVPMQGFGAYIAVDIGTTCTISAQNGDCSYLEINGVVIFDNR